MGNGEFWLLCYCIIVLLYYCVIVLLCYLVILLSCYLVSIKNDLFCVIFKDVY